MAFEIARSYGERLRGQRILIACSGGIDSMVLVDVLKHLAPRYDLHLALAHIHHGPSPARDRARDFVSKQDLEFFERKSERTLRSEAELREFRLAALRDLASGFDRIAIGHHADDLLETRLMRLIRGTGPQGLRAMRPLTREVVRPLLGKTRAQIETYAREQGLAWIDDPTNKDTSYLRNWIRHEWIPVLEAKRPGSKRSLHRSLDLLSSAAPRVAKASPQVGRKSFEQLTPSAKKSLLLAIANGQGVRDFGQSKIIEVLKRLDRLGVSRQRHARFVVGGVEWRVTPEEIVAAADAGPRS